MLGLVIAFAGIFIVLLGIFSQSQEYRGIPTPVTWEIRKSVEVALVGMLIFCVGVLIERAGI
jgi:hypothetical protein